MYSNPILKNITFCVSEGMDISTISPHLKCFNFITESVFLTNAAFPELYFLLNSNGLSLHEAKSQHITKKILFIDFISGKNGYRHAKNCTIKQPLAKAVGVKPGFRPTIFDATAGLGGDSFVLACLGCNVFLCERSPILFVLLQDALNRALARHKTSDIVKNKLHLSGKNSILALDNLTTQPDSIYLDPMYPHRSKSALNKKDMRIIRELVGDDDDSGVLLEKSLTVANNRVAVKRPKGAPYINQQKPSFEIKTKNSRFDIYLT